MDSPEAEISSVATALEELTRRVTQFADSYASTQRDEIAVELYAVERSLTSACRRLARVVNKTG